MMRWARDFSSLCFVVSAFFFLVGRFVGSVRRRWKLYVAVVGEGLHVQNVPVDGDLCTLLVRHDEGFASVQRIFLVLKER